MFNEFDALNLDHRKELLELIKSKANRDRKEKSIREHNIFKNKLEKEVKTELATYLSAESVKNMKLIHDVGICKRKVLNEASIYIDAPKREFSVKKKTTKKNIENLYSLMNINEVNKKQNRYFKLQKQNLSYIVMNSENKLVKKVLKLHEFDAIENNLDPSSPFGYVISNYNQPEKEDAQRYVIWTKDFNFTIDGNGAILTKPENMKNPIAPVLPFNEVSSDKDGSFYCDEDESSVDFTVTLNCAFSELYHIMRMQGFGQAVLTGPKKGLPQAHELKVGVNNIVVLLTEEGESADFKFVNANPDLSGSIETIATLLSAYLTAEGIDPKKISIKGDSPQSFASGFERFLSLIDEFKATKDDLELFKNVEKRDLEIIKAWLEKYSSVLHEDYRIKDNLKGVHVAPEFHRPEMIETKAEKTTRLDLEVSKGFKSKLDAMKEYYNLDSIDEAVEKYKQMLEHEKLVKEIESAYSTTPEQDEDDENEEDENAAS